MNAGTVSPALPSDRVEGFADVARWIALDSDNETSIYRKFDELAARNLLYLQAELLVLETQLKDLDRSDAASDYMHLKDAVRTWETLAQWHQSGSNEARARMDLIAQIRTKLKDYRMPLKSTTSAPETDTHLTRRGPPPPSRSRQAQAAQQTSLVRIPALVQEPLPTIRRAV
jgi:hypothetical protein